jgi:hypothetical protein
MDKQLADLCEKHGLTVISVMFNRNGEFTVFPHWDDEYGNDQCVTAHGSSFDEAFDRAIDQMCMRRIAA